MDSFFDLSMDVLDFSVDYIGLSINLLRLWCIVSILWYLITSIPIKEGSSGPPSKSVVGEFPQATKAKDWWKEPVIFQVQDTLFKVVPDAFERYSEVFHGMFRLPQSKEYTIEGQREGNPIHLPGCTPMEFRSLLEVFYTPASVDPLPFKKQRWLDVLKLANLWGMEQVRKRAIRELEKRSKANPSKSDFPTLERLKAAFEHRVPEWLIECSRDVISCLAGVDEAEVITDPEPLTLEGIARTLGWERTARLYEIASRVWYVRGKLSEPTYFTEPWVCPFCRPASGAVQEGQFVVYENTTRSGSPHLYGSCLEKGHTLFDCEVKLPSGRIGLKDVEAAVKEAFKDELSLM